MGKQTTGIWESLYKSELLVALVRHKLLAACLVILGLGLTAGYTASRPVLYRSTASVLIENFNRSFMSYEDQGITYVQDVTKAQRILAQSRPVILRTIEISGETVEITSENSLPNGFEARVDGQLLYLQVVDQKPERAMKLANAWSDAYVKEMTLRAQMPKAFMDKSLEERRKDWMAKQDALNKFKREANFDPKDYETNPVKKNYDELSTKLNDITVQLASLEAERQVLVNSAEDSTAILQIPRAKTDTTLNGLQRQIDAVVPLVEPAETAARSFARQCMNSAQTDAVAAGHKLAQSAREKLARVANAALGELAVATVLQAELAAVGLAGMLSEQIVREAGAAPAIKL